MSRDGGGEQSMLRVEVSGARFVCVCRVAIDEREGIAEMRGRCRV